VCAEKLIIVWLPPPSRREKAAHRELVVDAAGVRNSAGVAAARRYRDRDDIAWPNALLEQRCLPLRLPPRAAGRILLRVFETPRACGRTSMARARLLAGDGSVLAVCGPFPLVGR
jgi:hypothetical protein